MPLNSGVVGNDDDELVAAAAAAAAAAANFDSPAATAAAVDLLAVVVVVVSSFSLALSITSSLKPPHLRRYVPSRHFTDGLIAFKNR